MGGQITCRTEVIEAVQYIIDNKSKDNCFFTIQEVVDRMNMRNTIYKESSIRTHVASKLCSNAPKNHLIRYPDFIRISRGVYKKL